MSAFNMDDGRHANVAQIRTETEEGNYRPVTVKVTQRNCNVRMPKERQVNNQVEAVELGVSRMFLI